MTLLTTLPAVAFIIVIFFTVSALKPNRVFQEKAWIIAALFCGAFSVWTLITIFQEGPIGFWPVHTKSYWGNQVWFDLLMALTMAWVLILPRAKAVDMKSPFWLLFILSTGSIGFSAMLARLFYLEGTKA